MSSLPAWIAEAVDRLQLVVVGLLDAVDAVDLGELGEEVVRQFRPVRAGML